MSQPAMQIPGLGKEGTLRFYLVKKYLAALFDIDGVLVDSEHLHYLENKMFFARYGVQITEEDHKTYWMAERGRQTKGLIEDHKLDERFGLTVAYARQERDRIYREELVHKLEPMPGALETLLYLHEAGIHIAAVTSNYKKSAEATLKHCGMYPYIQTLVAMEDIPEGMYKPAPDSYILAAERLNLDPSVCIGFEDTRKGIISLRRAEIGMAVRCLYKWTDDQDFTGEARPDITVASLEEIFGLGFF